MTRILKLLVILAGVAFAAFVLYDLFAFQTRRDEINGLIAAAHPLDRSPPQALQVLLRVEHPDLAMSSSRVLLYDLFPVNYRSTLQRQAQWAAWSLLVRIHLGESEQLALLCSRSYLGRQGHGYQAAALSVYSRGLDQLDERELATLVVIARSPGKYRRPDRADDLALAADALLRRSRGRISRS